MNGRWFVAWKPHVSQGFTDTKAMLRWLGWPSKTPTGDELRGWLADLAAADAKREAGNAGPSQEDVVATGFGPECHLDESDPNFQTRTIPDALPKMRHPRHQRKQQDHHGQS
jgi:hypothetical protein